MTPRAVRTRVAVVPCSASPADRDEVEWVAASLRGRASVAVGVVDAPVPAADATLLIGVPVLGAASEPSGGLAGRIQRIARAGTPVLGVGEGFRLLCAWGLLDGLVRFASAGHPSIAHCRVEGIPTPFTQRLPVGRQLSSRARATRGHYECDDLDVVAGDGRVVLRYCSVDGHVDEASAADAAVNTVAGVCSRDGNVVGIAPPLIAASGARVGQRGDPAMLIDSVIAWHAGAPGRIAP